MADTHENGSIVPGGADGQDGHRDVGALPVTVVIPAKNEEKNLRAALETVDWADEVIVVDSSSTDATQDIAASMGAKVVQFAYSGHGPKKKNWALETIPFRNEWVLLLDADERVTPPLHAEIEAALRNPKADGYCIDRELVFMGKSLQCFRPNWNIRLFKHRLGRFEDLGLHEVPGTGDNEVHEHIVLDGSVAFMENHFLHNDYRGINAWLDRHNRYVTWEAHLYRRWRSEPIGVGPIGLVRLDPLRRKRALRRIWVRLPFRPGLRFGIWYFGRRGFLDGRAGLTYCMLMSFYELLVGIRLAELEREQPETTSHDTGRPFA